MAQFEALEFLKKPSPVPESIINQTDDLLDKKEEFIAEKQMAPVDLPEELLQEEVVTDEPVISTVSDTYSSITLDSINQTDISSLQSDQIDKDLLYASQALVFNENETDYDFFRSHPIDDELTELPQLFQQEFFDQFYESSSIEEQAALGFIDIDDPPLQPLQSPLFELSFAQSGRNLIQSALDFMNFISPMYGGDSWWNGAFKGRGDFLEGVDPKGIKAIELPNLRTPGGALDKSVQLVTEYFAPAGLAVKGSKLLTQLIVGSKTAKQTFTRGQEIGAFAVGFGAVDMALVQPNMKNLAGFLQDHKELEGPVGWFLDKMATDPDNPEWQNRFVRTIEGMGIGFTLEGALWFTKILTKGVADGTIHVVKPLDQELFNFMKANVREDITIAQYMWGTLKEYNPKKVLQNLIFKNMDQEYALRLMEGETGVMPSVMTLRHPDLLKEFQRLKKLPANKGLPDDQLRAQAEINVGKTGSGGNSAWAEFKLLKNVGRVIDNWFNEGTSNWRSLDATGKSKLDYGKLEINGQSFSKVMSEFITTQTQLKDFTYYLVAKRALNLQKRGFKGKEILKNWDQKKINQIIKNGDANPAFVKTLKNLQSYNKRLMDFAVDSGLISREAADNMLGANPVYVPFFRVTQTMDIEKGLIKTEIKQATRAKPYNLFTGGGGMIENPYQALMKNTAVIVEAAMRNRANQTLATLIETVYAKRITQATEMAKKLGYTGKEKTQFINNFSTKWAEPATAKDLAGIIHIDKKHLQEQLEKLGVKDINLDDEAVEQYVKLLYFNQKNIRTPNGELLFVANFKGKPKYYKITDEMLKTAVDTFGWKSFEYQGWVMQGLAKNKGMVSWLITRDPSFAMWANPVRDSWGGAINSTSWTRVPGLDTTIGVAKMMSYYFGKNPENHKIVLDYLNNGGGFGTIFTKNPEQYAYQLKKYFNKNLKIPLDDVITNPKQFGKIYGNFMGAFEHATRVREFDRLIKAGYSQREAAVMAREISIDFSMKGAGHVMTGLNQSVAFLNPGVQGMYKSMRTWFGEGRFTKTFIQANMYVGAPSATLWYLNHDNPDYQAYPDWAKRQAWFIPIGKVYDEALGRERTRFGLVPKPFDLYGMYANTTEAVLQAAWEATQKGVGGDHATTIMGEFVKSFYHNITHALPPVPLPPSFSLGFALFGNVDSFTGANIIPKRILNAPSEFQYTPWTPETMIALGNETGMSPIHLEQIYRKMLPGLGEKFLHILDYFTNEVTEGQWDNNRPVTLEDIPVLDRMYEDGIPTITQHEIDAYEEVATGLEDYVSESMIAELLLADDTRINAWLKNDDNRDKIMQRPVFLDYLMETGKRNRLIRNTTTDKSLSKDFRHKEVMRLQDQKRKLAEEFLDSLEFMRKYK